MSDVPAGLDEFIAQPETPAQASPSMATGQIDGSRPPEGLDDFIGEDMQQAKYGGAGQQALAGVEGLAKGFAGPLATGAERMMGVPSEDIEGRANANPWTHGISEGAGLVGGALTGTGEGALLGKIGEGAAALSGIGEASTLAKVGSAAVKGAIENAVFQGGDEVSKMILHPDTPPGEAVGTALVNVGSAALFGGIAGGGLGAVSPLWEATVAPKLEKFLGAIRDRANGQAIQLAPEIEEALATTGVQLDPVARAAMSGDPLAKERFNILREGKNQTVLDSIDNVQKATNEAVAKSFGKPLEDIANHSEAELGRSSMDSFKQEFKEKYAPISKEYEEVTDKFKDHEIPTFEAADPDLHAPPESAPAFREETQEALPNMGGAAETTQIPVQQEGLSFTPPESGPNYRGEMAESVTKVANDFGAVGPGAPGGHVVNLVMDRIPQLKTIQDVSNLLSTVRKMTQGDPMLWGVGGALKESLLASQQSILERTIGKEAPELFDRYMAVRGQYRDFARVTDEAAQNLSLGKTGGPKDFLSTLEEKRSPEEFLRKLSPKNNAEIIPFLEKNFPGTLENLRQNEFAKIAKSSIDRAGDEYTVNAKRLNAALDKLSPEMRSFALPQGAEDAIKAAQTLQGALPSFKSSGTAGWMDSLFSKLPASAGAVASMLMGHNPAVGFLLGQAGKLLARDAPDAMRLSYLKYLGSDKTVSAGGFKAMTDFIEQAAKGETLMNKAVVSVFKDGAKVLPESHFDDERGIERIRKAVAKAQTDPSDLFQVGGQTGHYMPDHGAAMATTATRVVQYLSKLQPNQTKTGILDSKPQVSKIATAEYNRALAIANRPLLVAHNIQNGTLTAQDVLAIRNMHPELATKLTQKLTHAMMDHVAKDGFVDYPKRLSLSLFLGQPLDSTMTPQGILGAQPKTAAQAPGEPPQGKPPTQHSMDQMSKSTASNAMPGDARLQRKQAGKV